MYEEMTYENILEDMLGRVTSDVDKREGSVIYDALAPCAYQLAQTYFNLNSFTDLVFGDTAVKEYLDRVVGTYGLTRKAATYAIRKIVTSKEADIGSRWGINGTTYVITGLLSQGLYRAACEQLGEIGNTYSGKLESIDNIYGITAVLSDIIASGEEEETDDALRERFYIRVKSASGSGNATDYKNWALSVAGVGGAKVFPVWNGTGTVKVLVVDENMAIDTDLPANVAAHIETVRPVGAAVTVDSPASHIINASAYVVLNGTKTLPEVQTEFIKLFTDYLKNTVFNTCTVSHAKTGNILLSVDGVDDFNSLMLNSKAASVSLTDTEIPVCGTVLLTEVS